VYGECAYALYSMLKCGLISEIVHMNSGAARMYSEMSASLAIVIIKLSSELTVEN